MNQRRGHRPLKSHRMEEAEPRQRFGGVLGGSRRIGEPAKEDKLSGYTSNDAYPFIVHLRQNTYELSVRFPCLSKPMSVELQGMSVEAFQPQ